MTYRGPDLPAIIQFTDRNDGTVWTLMHRASDDRLMLTDEQPRKHFRGHIRRFEAYGEPTLPGLPHVRVFVRGGRLGYETLPEPLPNAGPLMTRERYVYYALEIFAAGWRQAGDTLGWRTVEIER